MTVTDEMVERGARALHDLKFDSSEAWDTHNADYQNLYRSGARAALTAALSDQAVVPKEPTPEMAIAGRKALAIVADRMEEAKLLAVSSIDFWQRVGHEPANEIYRAMIAAAPPPSSTAGES